MTRVARKTPGQRRAERRQRLIDAAGTPCAYCHRIMRPGEPTLDHVVPRCRGGQNHAWNLVVCCKRCNNAKADRLIHEIGFGRRGPGPMRSVVLASLMSGAGLRGAWDRVRRWDYPLSVIRFAAVVAGVCAELGVAEFTDGWEVADA